MRLRGQGRYGPSASAGDDEDAWPEPQRIRRSRRTPSRIEAIRGRADIANRCHVGEPSSHPRVWGRFADAKPFDVDVPVIVKAIVDYAQASRAAESPRSRNELPDSTPLIACIGRRGASSRPAAAKIPIKSRHGRQTRRRNSSNEHSCFWHKCSEARQRAQSAGEKRAYLTTAIPFSRNRQRGGGVHYP
ncbi:hypothetical protein NVSP9465_03553 [Novosphingobium sp. CECT 9465]|nr:hypothetical protein NVSP9465_03553 [Novosphingobium sp. CECT 9465]